MLFAGVSVCTFQPGKITSWGSEGVNSVAFAAAIPYPGNATPTSCQGQWGSRKRIFFLKKIKYPSA